MDTDGDQKLVEQTPEPISHLFQKAKSVVESGVEVFIACSNIKSLSNPYIYSSIELKSNRKTFLELFPTLIELIGETTIDDQEGSEISFPATNPTSSSCSTSSNIIASTNDSSETLDSKSQTSKISKFSRNNENDALLSIYDSLSSYRRSNSKSSLQRKLDAIDATISKLASLRETLVSCGGTKEDFEKKPDHTSTKSSKGTASVSDINQDIKKESSVSVPQQPVDKKLKTPYSFFYAEKRPVFAQMNPKATPAEIRAMIENEWRKTSPADKEVYESKATLQIQDSSLSKKSSQTRTNSFPVPPKKIPSSKLKLSKNDTAPTATESIKKEKSSSRTKSTKNEPKTELENQPEVQKRDKSENEPKYKQGSQPEVKTETRNEAKTMNPESQSSLSLNNIPSSGSQTQENILLTSSHTTLRDDTDSESITSSSDVSDAISSSPAGSLESSPRVSVELPMPDGFIKKDTNSQSIEKTCSPRDGKDLSLEVSTSSSTTTTPITHTTSTAKSSNSEQSSASESAPNSISPTIPIDIPATITTIPIDIPELSVLDFASHWTTLEQNKFEGKLPTLYTHQIDQPTRKLNQENLAKSSTPSNTVININSSEVPKWRISYNPKLPSYDLKFELCAAIKHDASKPVVSNSLDPHCLKIVSADADSAHVFTFKTALTGSKTHYPSLEYHSSFNHSHSCALRAVKLSPDAKLLFTAGEDFLIKSWNLQTKQLEHTGVGHTDKIFCIDISPDGKMVATGSGDKQIIIWDALTLKEIKRLGANAHNKKLGPFEGVSSIAFSPDGKCIAAGSVDNSVRVWELETSSLLKRFDGHSEAVVSLAWAPDPKINTKETEKVSKAVSNDRTLCTGSLDKTVRQWNLKDGVFSQHFASGTDYVLSICYELKEANILFTGGKDKSIKIWTPSSSTLDPESGESASDIPIPPRAIVAAHTSSVLCISSGIYDHTYSCMASSGGDGWTLLWIFVPV